jgi:hypothetical protein
MKTIEETATDYGLEYVNSKYSDIHSMSAKFALAAVMQDFKAGVDYAQRWISVDEELPENTVYKDDFVLIKILFDDEHGKEEQVHINKRFDLGERIGFVWNSGYFEDEWKAKIIAWRPIELK